MCKIISLILISFFLYLFACSAQVPIGQSDKADYNAENNALNPDEWDFGKVKQGQILKHDFLLKNKTKNVLKIISINTSCGCTASGADKKILVPHDSAKINVTFNSGGYSGEVKQFVYVNTDNVDQPVVKFIIKSEVVK